METTTKRRKAAITLALIALPLTAACGDDSSSSASNPAPGTTPSPVHDHWTNLYGGFHSDYDVRFRCEGTNLLYQTPDGVVSVAANDKRCGGTGR